MGSSFASHLDPFSMSSYGERERKRSQSPSQHRSNGRSDYRDRDGQDGSGSTSRAGEDRRSDRLRDHDDRNGKRRSKYEDYDGDDRRDSRRSSGRSERYGGERKRHRSDSRSRSRSRSPRTSRSERERHRSRDERQEGNGRSDTARHNSGRSQAALPSQSSALASAGVPEGKKYGNKRPSRSPSPSAEAIEASKPNFSNSGALAAETNTFKGVVLKYNEPPEARKPSKGWRLYVFKGKEQVDMIQVNRQSAYLFGRDKVVSIILYGPS